MSTEQAETHRSTDAIFVGVAVALVGLVAAVWPATSPDYWFELVVGRLVATHQAIVDVNLFAFGAASTAELFVCGWLGQFWLLLLHEWGGMVTASLARNFCLIVATLAVAVAATRISRGRAAAASTVAVGFGLGLLFADGAPSSAMFTWPIGAFLALVVSTVRTTRAAVLAAVLGIGAAAFWANLGPGALTPALIFATAAVTLRSSSGPRNVMLLSTFAAVAATGLNPHGFALLSHFGPSDVALPLALAASAVAAVVVRGAPAPGRDLPLWAVIATVLVISLPTLALQPWSDTHRALPAAVWGESVRQDDPHRGFGTSALPVEAVALLRTWGSQPRTYVAPQYAGYALYELQSPDKPEPVVFTIPALQHLTDETSAAMRADREVMRGLLGQLQVDAVIVTPDEPELGTVMTDLDGWHLLGEWPTAKLYVETTLAKGRRR